MEDSCGPLTSDLPLGLCGAKGRSPHVVTACELLTSPWSPPLSLQDAVPPTTATSFFASLGKFNNSLSSRPPSSLMGHHNLSILTPRGMHSGMLWWLEPQLGRKFMPHYRKWAVYSPHHKQCGRCFNSSSQTQIDEFYSKNKTKQKQKPIMQQNLWDRCFKSTIVLNVCHYTVSGNYIYTAVKKGKRKARSLKWSEVKFSCLCSIKPCASLAFHLEIQFTIV